MSQVTYQVERWHSVKEEMIPLFPGHWEEMALHKDKVSLDPDYSFYDNMQLMSILHIVVGRSEGRIVGYAVYFVQPHKHYQSTLFAVSDIYWLDPAFRNKGNGVRLFEAVEKSLRDRGVKVVMTGNKTHQDHSELFRHLGHERCEVWHTKWLGD